jgi:hypothetical protein
MSLPQVHCDLGSSNVVLGTGVNHSFDIRRLGGRHPYCSYDRGALHVHGLFHAVTCLATTALGLSRHTGVVVIAISIPVPDSEK